MNGEDAESDLIGEDVEALAKFIVSSLLAPPGSTAGLDVEMDELLPRAYLGPISTQICRDLDPDPVEARGELERRGLWAASLVGCVAQIAVSVIRMAEMGTLDPESVRRQMIGPYAALSELDDPFPHSDE